MHAHTIARDLCERCREADVRVLGIAGGRLCATCGLDDLRAHHEAVRSAETASHRLDRAV